MNQDLSKFINSFSILDFIAYWSSGAFFVLFYYWMLDEAHRVVFIGPLETMFPNSEFAKAIYFCICSYFCGFFLSGLGRLIHEFIDLCIKVLCLEQRVEALRGYFKSKYCNRSKKQPEEELFRKRQLFQSYYTLCRCLSTSCFILFVHCCVFTTPISSLTEITSEGIELPFSCTKIFLAFFMFLSICRGYYFKLFYETYNDEIIKLQK